METLSTQAVPLKPQGATEPPSENPGRAQEIGHLQWTLVLLVLLAGGHTSGGEDVEGGQQLSFPL